jgi:hypothetical protein
MNFSTIQIRTWANQLAIQSSLAIVIADANALVTASVEVQQCN